MVMHSKCGSSLSFHPSIVHNIVHIININFTQNNKIGVGNKNKLY